MIIAWRYFKWGVGCMVRCIENATMEGENKEVHIAPYMGVVPSRSE